MSRFDKAVAVVLAFLLSLLGAVIAVVSIIMGTVGNPDFMIRVLDNRNYYDSIYIEYTDEVEALAIPSGVDEGIFSSLVSKDEFKKDVNKFIHNAYESIDEYAGASINYKDIYDRFYNSMVVYAEGKGIEVTDELRVGLDNVAGLCASTYEVYICVPLVDMIGSYANIFHKYLVGALIAAGLFLALLVVFVAITPKWRNIAFKLFSVMLITDGLFLLLAPLCVLISGKITYLNIATRSLYDFAVGYCEHTMETFVYSGLIILSIPIVFYAFKKLYNRAKLKK